MRFAKKAPHTEIKIENVTFSLFFFIKSYPNTGCQDMSITYTTEQSQKYKVMSVVQYVGNLH